MRSGLLLLGVVGLVACGQHGAKQPCTSMAGQSAIVAQTQLFEVSVYKGTVDCAAPIGPVVQQQRYARGATIELTVPSGPHTVILVAFGDADGTRPIGRACQQGDFSKGAQLCFDVTVQPVYDLAEGDAAIDGGLLDLATSDLGMSDLSTSSDLSSTDLSQRECFVDNDCVLAARPPRCNPDGVCVGCLQPSDCETGSGCCDFICTSLKTLANCGACGQGCGGASAHGTPSCDTGACVVACDKGYESCDDTMLNGCETNIAADPDHCGSCTRACKKDNGVSVASCSGGKCNSTCSAPAGNCAQPDAPTADDGCETPLNTTTNCLQCGVQCQGNDVENNAGTCSATGCTYVCKDGYADCDTSPAQGGCECATSPADTPLETVGSVEWRGTAGCCDSGCQTMHDSGVSPGVGQPTVKHFSCQPKGVNEKNATLACAVWANDCSVSVCPDDPTSLRVCGHYRNGPQFCLCWEYASMTNPTFVGHVQVTELKAGETICGCPTAVNFTWD